MSQTPELTPTVNLVPNPLAARDLAGWSGRNGATVARDPDRAWEDDGASVRVDVPGLAPDEGVVVRTVEGLDRIGVERTDWGQIRVAAGGVPVDVRLRGFYADGTAQDGDRATVLATRDGLTAGAWHRALAPAFVADPARTLVRAELVASVAAPSGPRAFWATGAQVEEDRDGGHTPFAYGGYGPPWHRWAGAEHASVSVREPVPMTSPAAGPGAISFDFALWRATWDNRWKEDVSGGFTGPVSVSLATDRAVTRTLSATVMGELWGRLRPYHDWIAPVLTVTMADGSVRSGQLGLFVVRESPATHAERGSTVALNAMDPLWLLGQQQGTGPIRVFEGEDKVRAVKAVLNLAAFAEDADGRRRFGGPDAGKQWKRNREWEEETTFLDFCNQALRGAVMTELFSTNEGQLAWHRRDRQRLRRRTPVRAWAANVGPEQRERIDGVAGIARRAAAASPLPSEVVGEVSSEPGGDLDNEVVVVDDGPGRRPIWIVHRVRGNRGNPREAHAERGRRKGKPVRGAAIDDEATARELAEALAEEMSARNRTYTVEVIPDPGVEYAHETVACAIYNARGENVMVGHFAVLGVDWTADPGDGTATQTMTLGRLDSAINAYQETGQ